MAEPSAAFAAGTAVVKLMQAGSVGIRVRALRVAEEATAPDTPGAFLVPASLVLKDPGNRQATFVHDLARTPLVEELSPKVYASARPSGWGGDTRHWLCF